MCILDSLLSDLNKRRFGKQLHRTSEDKLTCYKKYIYNTFNNYFISKDNVTWNILVCRKIATTLIRGHFCLHREISREEPTSARMTLLICILSKHWLFRKRSNMKVNKMKIVFHLLTNINNKIRIIIRWIIRTVCCKMSYFFNLRTKYFSFFLLLNHIKLINKHIRLALSVELLLSKNI